MYILALILLRVCVQDGADAGGADQRERRQFEQLPRGPHGKDHLRQRREGDVAFKTHLVGRHFCLPPHAQTCCCPSVCFRAGRRWSGSSGAWTQRSRSWRWRPAGPYALRWQRPLQTNDPFFLPKLLSLSPNPKLVDLSDTPQTLLLTSPV